MARRRLARSASCWAVSSTCCLARDHVFFLQRQAAFIQNGHHQIFFKGIQAPGWASMATPATAIYLSWNRALPYTGIWRWAGYWWWRRRACCFYAPIRLLPARHGSGIGDISARQHSMGSTLHCPAYAFSCSRVQKQVPFQQFAQLRGCHRRGWRRRPYGASGASGWFPAAFPCDRPYWRSDWPAPLMRVVRELTSRATINMMPKGDQIARI